MFAIEMQAQLQQLQAERSLALLEGHESDATHLADLHEEIAATRHAYVAAVITEIATLRAELSGPQVG